MFNKLKTIAVMSVVCAFVGSSASAVTAVPTGEKCGNKWIALTQDGIELTANICDTGNSTGNNSPIEADGWTDLAELSSEGTSGILTVNSTNMTWSLSSTGGYSELGISVKQGNGFAFYELDLNSTLSGMFFTGNNSSPTGADFSHINAWGMGSISTVPLPAGAWFLLAGIGGLAALRRRKKV